MRKISASLLVLIAILTVFGSAVSALARPADTVDPFQTNLAYTHLVIKNLHAIANSGSGGFTPAQLRKAYGVDALVNTKGKGITVAIIDACGNPHAQADLDHYDSTYGLPATTIKVVTHGGTPCTPLDVWSVETDLDIQMVHAIAPRASIVLEVARGATLFNLDNAAKDAYTNQGATVVSMSFGGLEFPGEIGPNGDGIFSAGNARGVSFIASSGDSGCRTQYPAASPFVTAVGGTDLKTRPDGTYVSESASPGSGGGLSKYESRPLYQDGFNSNAKRGIPDVAMIDSPGVSMYDSDFGGFIVAAGTSVSAPLWAGVLALANGKRSHTMMNANIELYSVAGHPVKYTSDYHDITTGRPNSSCKAASGYDLATGLGTPLANRLVPDLIAAP